MYAKFINEDQIEEAPVNLGPVSNFNLSVELVTAAGFLPVEIIEETSPEKPIIKYRLVDGKIEQYAQVVPVPEITLEEKEKQIRWRRNQMLSICDWTQLDDSPLTAEEKGAWRVYRQALRDVPLQAGFPENVTWPEVETLKESEVSNG